MRSLFRLGLAGALGSAALMTLLSGCVVDGMSYSYGGDVDVGVDYYQPAGSVVVGNWGPGYHVGPPPRGGDRPEPGGNHAGDGHPASPGNAGHVAVTSNSGTHAFHPAPPTHAAPSIPSHGRK